MPRDEWSIVASFGDQISAEALAGLFESEHLPHRIASDAVIPGLGFQFAVLVPTELLHRANSIRKQAGVSEQELTYLATGELPGGDAKS